MEKWVDMMFGDSFGLTGMIVIFGAIAVAAFLVTMLVVRSSEDK